MSAEKTKNTPRKIVGERDGISGDSSPKKILSPEIVFKLADPVSKPEPMAFK